MLGKWVDRHKKSAKEIATGDPSHYFENIINDLKSLGLVLDLAHNPSVYSAVPQITAQTSSATTAAVAATSGDLIRL